MPQRIKQGDRLPFFRYDTPYSSQERSRDLLAAHPPLILVFMSNFGHPITRTFAERYAATHASLTSGSVAMVVRSQPEKLADSIGPGTLPFPLLCDAEGALYDLLQIPQRSGTLTTYSLEGWQIVRAARRQGYRPTKGALQQLPLTLILDASGQVLFAHYGASLTDVPEDCAAMQQLLVALGLAAAPDTGADKAADEAFALEDLPVAEDVPVDVFAEAPPDAAQAQLRDPDDTWTGSLPLEDLAPEPPSGFAGGSGAFPPAELFPPQAYLPHEPVAPAVQQAPAPKAQKPAKPQARRHRPATRRYDPGPIASGDTTLAGFEDLDLQAFLSGSAKN